MRFLQGFNKVLGVILYIFGVLFLVAFTLGAFLISIWLILMPWIAMPFGIDNMLLDLEFKIFISFMGGVLLFVLLMIIYLELDRTINPPKYPIVPPIVRPKRPKSETKRKPILG